MKKTIKKALLTSCLGLWTAPVLAVPMIYDGTIDWLGGNDIGNDAYLDYTQSTVGYISFAVPERTLSVEIDVLSHEFNDTTLQYEDVNGDGEIAYIDASILLFMDDGDLDETDWTFQSSQFSFNTFEDGSINFLDPYLFLDNILSPGNYLLAIGDGDFGLEQAVAGINDRSYGPWGIDDTVVASGDYRVTINIEVPEPGVLLLLATGVLGLALYRREHAANGTCLPGTPV